MGVSFLRRSSAKATVLVSRRILLLALGAAAAFTPTMSRADAQVTVVYVAAWDCAPCITWTNMYWESFKASPEFAKLRWVKINSPRIRAAYEDQYWPEDLRRFRDRAKVTRGVPRWLIIKGEELVANGRPEGGGEWQDWKGDVLPAIKKALVDVQ